MMIRVEYDHEPERCSAFTVSKGWGLVEVFAEEFENSFWVRRPGGPCVQGEADVMVNVALAIIRMAGAEQKAIEQLAADPDERTG